MFGVCYVFLLLVLSQSHAPGFNLLPLGFPFPARGPKAPANFPTQHRFRACGGDFGFPLIISFCVGSHEDPVVRLGAGMRPGQIRSIPT
jgi:hypothetical protein